MTVRFAVVEIVTADMPRSLAFYRTLGIEVPPEADQEDHVEFPLPGGLRLSWDTPDVMTSFDPGWSPGGGGHSLGLAFRCVSPAEVVALYASVTSAGFTGHLPPWDAFWGQRYAVLRDPDLNSVDLFAELGH